LKILPAAFIVLGDSLEEAKQKRAKLDSLVHYDSGIASLSIALGHDVSGFDPDDYLPQIPETNASKSGRAQVLKLAEEEKLTVRQLAQRYGGYSGLAFVGTVESVADEMQKWLEENASDGFTVVFPFLPQGLDDVAERLVPELQRRGIFRTDYEGSTLREHLGLPRPSNRFFDGS
jgi:alkanesulfonate monooxygenase SsuD/methylene tetrahydromethanopterin reductase-like flavin-dependent oxidoreductase (luciferase family)